MAATERVSVQPLAIVQYDLTEGEWTSRLFFVEWSRSDPTYYRVQNMFRCESGHTFIEDHVARLFRCFPNLHIKVKKPWASVHLYRC